MQRSMGIFKYYSINIKKFNPYLSVKNVRSLTSVLNTDVQGSEEKLHNIQVSRFLQPYVNSSVSDILSNVDKAVILPRDSVTLLKALRMQVIFRKISPDSFVGDERFEILCSIFGYNCKKLNPNVLISGLRSLLEVGVPYDARCVIEAEETILNKIMEFNITELIACLCFHKNHMQTDLQKRVILLVVDEIKGRTSEIETGAEILMLLKVIHIFDFDHRKILESRIVELCSTLNMYELTKILLLLSEKTLRNKPILNAISKQMRQGLETPDIKDVIDILYALKTLKYCDANLIYFLLDNQISTISSITEPLLISRLLTACGHLKWRHFGVLDECCKWIIDHIDICGTRELTACILTLAALNYASSKSNEALKSILPLLSLEKVGDPDVWLDVVWSLAVLDSLDRETLQAVLTKEFYESLIGGLHFKNLKNSLKLMNLKGFMIEKYPECIFGCNLHLQPVEIFHSSEEKNCRLDVMKALANFIPMEKYLCINQITDTGIFIDAEFIMNEKGKPLSIHDYGVLADTSNSFKSLPKNSKRFALLVLFYDNYTLNEELLTGISALTVRLLTGKYDAVVQIPYQEFSKERTVLGKVKYLMKKINQAY